MTIEKTPIVPPSMQAVVHAKGYLPGLRVGDIVFLAGQVGRTVDMEIVTDPRAQFEAAFENLRLVLAEAGCTFDDVVDMTTYHVDMDAHWPVFREVKNRVLPHGKFPWTAIGVSALADPAFLLEVKATACVRG
ncbi:MAG: RidA family protein [Burkholderiales bacterium]